MVNVKLLNDNCQELEKKNEVLKRVAKTYMQERDRIHANDMNLINELNQEIHDIYDEVNNALDKRHISKRNAIQALRNILTIIDGDEEYVDEDDYEYDD